MDKEELRKAFRERRRAVSPAERGEASRVIGERLLARAEIGAALKARRVIAVYLASPDEIDLSAFMRRALEEGGRLAAPRWNGTTYEMAPLAASDAPVVGPHGIREPEAGVLESPPSVWLVPGLAFTRTGKRLGYGGGWYDRLLAAASPDAVKLGVAYGFQLVGDLPTEAHDELLDDVVTETERN